MAELSVVYGNTQENYNQPHSSNQLQNSVGNLKNDNNQYNNITENMYNSNNNPQTINNNDESKQEVDKVIEKMQKHIDKQKKINELKEEFKKVKSNNDSIIDSYIKKKKDVLKFFLYSLAIVLALVIVDMIKVYLNKYLLSNDVTSKNEFYLRLAIPLTVIFIIWSIKVISF